MSQINDNTITIQGPKSTLSINTNDKLAMKMAMIFEGQCTKLGPIKSSKKYGYTKQWYYKMLHQYEKEGSLALAPRMQGPKKNYARTEELTIQVIRYRFLDPDVKAEVIAQKMTQAGFPQISKRSVQRIIAEYGLQKKTIKSGDQLQNRLLKLILQKTEEKE